MWKIRFDCINYIFCFCFLNSDADFIVNNSLKNTFEIRVNTISRIFNFITF